MDSLEVLRPTKELKAIWDDSFSEREYWQSWYLDIVCPNWRILASKETRIPMMPLCFHKAGSWTQRLQQPYWTQCLPVNIPAGFSTTKVCEWIDKTYFSYQIQLNIHCPSLNPTQAKNLILPLHAESNALLQQMSENRRRNVKRFEEKGFPIEENNTLKPLLEQFQLEKGNRNWKPSAYSLRLLRKVVEEGARLGKVKVIQCTNHEGQYLAAGIFLKNRSRITYLFGSSSEQGRKENAMAGIFWSIMKMHAKSSMVFDFEGGNLAGTGRFYKEFGAFEEPYYVYRKKLFGIL